MPSPHDSAPQPTATADPNHFGSLSDITVIDLTQMLAGPYGTMVLADHGAQVIKVEPLGGDMTRGGPWRADDELKILGAYFQSIDRNKRSICLDLKSEEGRQVFKQLIRSADAVTENFRAGVMERLGLGYEVLREINPRLVYGALRGFGDRRTGASPYHDWPAYDVVAQAMGGIMAITGPEPGGIPTKVGPGVGDIIPGMMLGFGVLAAVHHARRTGVGQFVDISMVDAVLATCERMVWQHSVEGLVPGPEGNHHPFLCPFGIFPAADGHIALAAHQDEFFDILCNRIDAPRLTKDPRYLNRLSRTEHRRALVAELGEQTRRFSKAELMARLGGHLPFGPVMNIADIEADPHFAVREMIVDVEQPGSTPIRVAGVPIKMTATPGGVRRRSPLLGEDTRSKLRELGLSDAEIQGLIDRRVAIASDIEEIKGS